MKQKEKGEKPRRTKKRQTSQRGEKEIVGRGRGRQSCSRSFCPVSVVRTYCHWCKWGWVFGFQLVEKHMEDAGYLNLDKIKDPLFLKGPMIRVGFIQLSEGLSKRDSLLRSICNQ